MVRVFYSFFFFLWKRPFRSTDQILTRSHSGSGATVQRGDHGPAAEHPPQQDPAASPPRHTFQSADRLRGAAAQARVPGKPGLYFTDRHHKGQGNE